MKMKILLAILLAVILLTACGSEEKKNTGEAESGTEEISNTEEETPEENAEDTTVTDEETVEEESAVSEIEMGDKLEDFTVSVHGTVYQFPCDLQVFLDNGWEPRSSSVLDKVLNWGEDNCMIDMYYQGDANLHMTVFLWNNSTDARPIKEVQAAGVGYMSPEIELIFPGDLHFVKGETTEEDIIAKYGGDGQSYIAGENSTDTVYVFYDYGDVYSFEFLKNIPVDMKD